MGTQSNFPPTTSGDQATSMKPNKDLPAKQIPLRLPRSLRASATFMADREGISLNHFINLAVAEKVSRIQQENSSPPIPKRAPKTR
jgi:HicB family